jgi:hypothetical protein
VEGRREQKRLRTSWFGRSMSLGDSSQGEYRATKMRRRLLPLLLLALLAFVGAAGAVSAGSGAWPPAWGRAIEVPHTATLNRGGAAVVKSVSCALAHNCAAGGFYTDSHGHHQAFVIDETNGVWGTAIEVPGSGNLNKGGQAEIRSISCARPQYCTAGGYYTGGFGGHQAFVVQKVNGTWGTAIDVPGTAVLNGEGDAAVNSVGCADPGKCSIGGYYTDNVGDRQGFLSAEWHDKWRTVYRPAHGTGLLNAGGNAQIESVSCPYGAYCTAGGYYTQGGTQHRQAFVVRQAAGHWGVAIEVPGTASLNSGKHDGAIVRSVSCATIGNCTAGGRYADHKGHYQAFVADLTNGTWGTAIEVPGTGTLNKGGDAGVGSVSCATAASCTAGGDYKDGSSKHQAFVVDKTNGSWGNAIEIPGIGALNKGGRAHVNSVSCATRGNCTAGGYYTNSSHKRQAFVADETNGSWGNAIEVPGTASLNSRGDAQVESVSCATARKCTAGGYYTDRHKHKQAFAVGSAPPLSLNPGTTFCDGAYAGTGDHVVVPDGGTCTLVAGTQVTGDVTVSNGGTLYATEVEIDGVLTVSGSATVCQSTVLSDVRAASPGGFLRLGGSDCAGGNTFSHNVVVSHDKHNLWIWHNKITGNLTVRYAHGRIDSIRSNSVHNGKIAHSGPVLVVDNHATHNLICTANKHQRGHGNRAHHKNTCPK